MIGYIPQGLNKLSTLWKAPIPEYALNSNENGLPALSFGYIISALTGILAIVTAIYLFARILMKKR
jgi:cobalt/nickel transport system permease protein/cobalt/nickel transport protein